VFQIHEDTASVPAEQKNVSFRNYEKNPLTPHNKNVSKRDFPQSKTPKQSTTKTSTTKRKVNNVYETDLTSIRRSIRSTMSPPSSSNDGQTKKLSLEKDIGELKRGKKSNNLVSSSNRSPNSPLSSLLRRSMLKSSTKLGPAQRLPSPGSASMLQDELDAGPDMSLLTSPSMNSSIEETFRSPARTESMTQNEENLAITDKLSLESVIEDEQVVFNNLPLQKTVDENGSILSSPSAMVNSNEIRNKQENVSNKTKRGKRTTSTPRIEIGEVLSRRPLQALADNTANIIMTPSAKPKQDQATTSELRLKESRLKLSERKHEGFDAEMSLLVSPAAMGNPNELVGSPADIRESGSSTFLGRESIENSMLLCSKMKQITTKDYDMREASTKKLVKFLAKTQETASSKVSQEERASSSNRIIKANPTATIFSNEFQNGVIVNFGGMDLNIVGQARSLPFVIKSSPKESEDLVLEIMRVPFIKGINLVMEDPSSSVLKGLTSSIKKRGRGIGGPTVQSCITIGKGGEVTLWVTWTPVKTGNIKEYILLKLRQGKQLLHVTITGSAENVQTKKTRILSTPSHANRSKLLLAAKDNLTPARVTSQPILSSSIVKAAKLSIPEDWAEKQCLAFTEWLNYLFNPTEDMEHELTVPSHINCGALKTLFIHQRLARARTRALQVFHTNEMTKARSAIVSEIAKGRFSLRSDRDINADLTLRERVVSILLSYSTQWLRIGLEVLFGEPIVPQAKQISNPASNKLKQGKKTKKLSGMKFVLKNFIVTRVLSDSETLQKYTRGRCSIPSGSFEKKYREEMRVLILTRLLLLVIFLDKAKMANALDRVPCLFVKESKMKSTSDVLIKFCRECLSSEGNIIKHLSRIGISVSYKQEPIDELDFTVTNLAADIRDGVRLTRVAEILTNAVPKCLLTKLRLPAVSRLQKLHNVGVALSLFDKAGAQNISEIAAHHIVDGYREQVLQLLWMIAAQCGILNILDFDTLEEEINKVKSSRRSDAIKWDLWDRNQSLIQRNVNVNESCILEEKIKALLIQWCSAVTSKFGIQVYDITHSFDDGVALCLLIHYYHPGLLLLDDIRATSRHGIHGEEASANEKHNICLAFDRMSQLGGMPKFLNTGKPRSKTEEKSMFLCLVYLCARLIESSTEIHACLFIQKWYRQKKEIELTRKKIIASKKIWRGWLEHKEFYYAAQRKKFGKSVEIIECFVCSMKERLLELRNKRILQECLEQCAVVIQARVRRYQVRKRFTILRKLTLSASTIQRCWKCQNLKKTLNRLIQQRKAATIIQAACRKHLCNLTLSRAAFFLIKIQARIRGFLTRTRMKHRYNTATKIQSVWRGFICQILFQVDMLDILTVQSITRRFLAIKKYRKSLKALLVLQCFIRKVNARRELSERKYKSDLLMTRNKAAATIQGMMRGIAIRRVILRNIMIVKIQLFIRRWLKRLNIKRRVDKIIKVQSVARRFIAHSKELKMSSSVLRIQSAWRQYRDGIIYKRTLNAIMKIQSFFRLKLVSKQLAFQNISCICIQRAFRSKQRYGVSKQARVLHEALEEAKDEMYAAIRIQSGIRRFQCRREVVNRRSVLNNAATIIQSKWRGSSAVNNLRSLTQVIILIQRVFRGYAIRRKKSQLVTAAKLIQKSWRRCQNLNKYRQSKKSVLVLQCKARVMLAKQSFHSKKASIMRIQIFVRSQLARKRLAALLSEEKVKHAAIIIQSNLRRTVAKARFLRMQRGAVIVQVMWRMYKRRLYYTIARGCIIRIQSVTRGFLSKKRRTARQLAVLKIQSFSRINMAKSQLERLREENIKFIALSCCAIRIQSFFRGYLARQCFERNITAAITIQRKWKSFLASQQFESDLKDIIVVQSAFRRWSARCIVVKKLEALDVIQVTSCRWLARSRAKKVVINMVYERRMRNESAIRLQCLARVYFAKSLAKRQRAAIQIQKTWRCFSVHVDYLVAIIDVTNIQRHIRGYLARVNIEIENFAAVEVQRIWRGFADRAKYTRRSAMILRIQSIFRRKISIKKFQLLRKHAEIESRFRNSKAKVIQKALRGYCQLLTFERGATMLQKVVRGYFARVLIHRKNLSLSLIQACCRGFLVRRSRSKKVLHIARLVAAANMHAIRNPSLVLGERTRVALYELRTSKRLTEITDAAITLEMSTRLSRNCCVAFVNVGAPSILYELLGTCNRSLPHVEIVRIVLLTLRNVSKHKDLLNDVATPGSGGVILDLVQMFRDKDDVFVVALIIFSRLLRYNKKLKETCSQPENMKRLTHVLKKVAPSGSDLRIPGSRHGTSKRKKSIKALRSIIEFLKE